VDIRVECVTPDGLSGKKRVWFRGIFHLIGILGESPFVSKLRKAESAQHSVHPVSYTRRRKGDGVEGSGGDANHPTTSTPSPSDLGTRTSCTLRCERLSRMVPQIQPDHTVKNILRLERHNWVTGTGQVKDLQGGNGGRNESIHRNRLE